MGSYAKWVDYKRNNKCKLFLSNSFRKKVISRPFFLAFWVCLKKTAYSISKTNLEIFSLLIDSRRHAYIYYMKSMLKLELFTLHLVHILVALRRKKSWIKCSFSPHTTLKTYYFPQSTWKKTMTELKFFFVFNSCRTIAQFFHSLLAVFN
jgi:hypothetical protein